MIVSVTANTSTSPRTGVITVTAGGASATLTVTQAGAAATCGGSFAAACAWDLTATVIAPNGTNPHYLRFVAPVTGQFTFESADRASTTDPYGLLYNSSQQLLASNDDSAGNLNFRITAALTAGQTYYLAGRNYAATQSGQYTVTAQTPAATTCQSFAAACTWDLSPVAVAPAGGAVHYLRFVAPVTGQYTFESANRPTSADPYGLLYNSSQQLLATNDDSAGDLNFRITANLQAGQTYYLAGRHYASTQSGQYTIRVTSRPN